MEIKTTKKSLKKYIFETLDRLLKIEELKEELQRAESDLQLLSEKKYSKKASDFISKEIGHLINDKGYSHDRAVAAALNIAKDKGYKIPKKTDESEESSINKVKIKPSKKK